VAKSWWQVEKVSPLKMYEENKSIGGLHLRHLLKSGKKEFIGEKLEKIWKLMAEGKLEPVVDSTLNFREASITRIYRAFARISINHFQLVLIIHPHYVLIPRSQVTDGMSKLHERKNIGKILLSFEEVPKENEG